MWRLFYGSEPLAIGTSQVQVLLNTLKEQQGTIKDLLNTAEYRYDKGSDNPKLTLIYSPLSFFVMVWFQVLLSFFVVFSRSSRSPLLHLAVFSKSFVAPLWCFRGTSNYAQQVLQALYGTAGVEVGGVESRGCSWFESTLKVLQLINKYLVVSCAVFNYLVLGLKAPCSFLCCFQLPCSGYKSTL